MNKWIFYSVTLFCLVIIPCGTTTQLQAQEQTLKSDLILWYDKPAEQWTEALPVGNGRLGAMVFGGVEHEKLQFNEDTLWTGRVHDYANPNAYKYLDEIRKLIFEAKQKEAEQLAMERFMSIPLRQKSYQPFGDILIDFEDHEEVSDYKRLLDLQTATAVTSYKIDDAAYTRKVFASYPDNVLVVYLACDNVGGLNFIVGMTSPHKNTQITAPDNETIILRGQMYDDKEYNQETAPDVLRFESHLKMHVTGGMVSVEDNKLVVDNANSAVLILAAATSYKKYNDVTGNPDEICKSILNKVANKSYEQLYNRHLEDYTALFGRVKLDLGRTEAVELPTDERLMRFADVNDPQLATLYFQYGRYLLISSSRPGTQPANLQGIWNDRMQPPWDSKWTVNINTEMNYWPTELTNLSECHEPLFDMIEDVAETGSKTAKAHYNCNGWVLHHNTDIWRGSAPINHSNHGIWPTGGGWLSQHFWYRYEFTQDKEFLRNRAYPILKGSALFFADYLVEDPKTGWLISTPSNSPENGGLVAGPTMDHQIIRDVFTNCIKAGEILNVDAEFRTLLEAKLKKLAPMQIGKYGQLQEWLEDKDDPNNKHRHVSHLYGLHPSSQITKRGTPLLFEAAKKSLQFRGDGGTGWSMAWKINFWARFEDGDHAYQMLKNQLRLTGSSKTEYDGGGTYPNLFDAHPPFQIDGNFGATSGIAEMLLQSHAGEIHLLPALPNAWPEGSVKGLCARGGFEVDIEWEKGTIIKALIKSKAGNKCNIRYGEKTIELETVKGNSYKLNHLLETI